MTAQYKMRTQTTQNNRGLAHVTIRLEKHLFLDNSTLQKFKNAIDSAKQFDGVPELIGKTEGVLKALGAETPSAALLGLETEWLPISEHGAELLIDKWYQVNPSFRASLEGGAKDGKLLLSVGKASAVFALTKAQAQADKDQLEKLKKYCEANPPQSPSDAQRAVDAIVGVGGQTTAIMAASEACLVGAAEDGVIGGMAGQVLGAAIGAAVGCIGAVAIALGTFLGLVQSTEKQQESDKEMRDRERVCGPTAGEPSPGAMDRYSRTC